MPQTSFEEPEPGVAGPPRYSRCSRFLESRFAYLDRRTGTALLNPPTSHGDVERKGLPIMAGTAVFAYDGSEDARRAVAAAHDLLAVDRAIIVHVRVIPPPPIIGADPAGDESAPTEHTTPEQADRIANDGVDVATEAGFEAESVVTTADSTTGVWKTILDVADERGAVAIVAGHRGLSRFRSAVLGSISNGLVNHAHLPILVVPQPRR
jgi:nucleotide-binding universal stress UspA family protein